MYQIGGWVYSKDSADTVVKIKITPAKNWSPVSSLYEVTSLIKISRLILDWQRWNISAWFTTGKDIKDQPISLFHSIILQKGQKITQKTFLRVTVNLPNINQTSYYCFLVQYDLQQTITFTFLLPLLQLYVTPGCLLVIVSPVVLVWVVELPWDLLLLSMFTVHTKRTA
jgi:hypothetical protein